MKKEVVAVGEKVFVVAENGDTLELTGENGVEHFAKALKTGWPEESVTEEIEKRREEARENPDELVPHEEVEESAAEAGDE